MTRTPNSPNLKEPAPDPGAVLIRRIRTRKEDSAFVYAILESHEGIASYSTLEHVQGAPHRDLELSIPLSRQADAERVLNSLGDLLYDLETSS